MLQRCFNPDAPEYRNYGARDITVCERWRNSFEAFYSDIGPRPTKNHSIERINNSGDYSPENCRWATQKEQSRNKRNNRFLTYKGETLSMVEWAERLGMSYSVLNNRMFYNWPIERALTEPVHPNSRSKK